MGRKEGSKTIRSFGKDFVGVFGTAFFGSIPIVIILALFGFVASLPLINLGNWIVENLFGIKNSLFGFFSILVLFYFYGWILMKTNVLSRLKRVFRRRPLLFKVF